MVFQFLLSSSLSITVNKLKQTAVVKVPLICASWEIVRAKLCNIYPEQKYADM